MPESRWLPRRPLERLEKELRCGGFFHHQTLLWRGQWCMGDFRRCKVGAGRVGEGVVLSIPAGRTVIGGGGRGKAWWLRRRETGDAGWEKERRQFYSAAAGVSIFREIWGILGVGVKKILHYAF